MESHSSNLDEIQKWFLQVLQHELPGKVYIKDIKYKEKDTTTKKKYTTIHCCVSELGLPKEFTAYQCDVSSGEYVKFRWKNPSQYADDNTPEAIEIQRADENEINKLKEDIQKLLVPGIRRRLKKKLGEIHLIKEQEVQRAEKSKEEAERLWALIEPYHHAVPLLSQDKSPTTHNQLGQNWNQMLESSGLLLDPSIGTSYLLALLSAFYSGSLILLNGSVGVGKTSLVEYSATLLGGQHAVIPVRPAWLDPSDLLGFFDPLSVTFRPTPFMTALKDANKHPDNKHPDRLFLVCLDELNLAKIENYGADLLSSLEYSRKETSSAHQRGLLLYSESIERDLKYELEVLEENSILDIKQTLRIRTIESMLNEYPANFAIPKNLVLIATLNTDETTYDLSPKVIDRSFVITYPPADLGNDGVETPFPPESIKQEISVDSLKNEIKKQLCGKNNGGWKEVVKWNEYLSQHKLGIPLGYRAKKDYKVFSAVAHCLGIEEKEYLGHFLFTKILPRISFFKGINFDNTDNTSREDLCRQWFEEVEGDEGLGASEVIKIVINQMREQLNDERQHHVRYWG